MKITGNGKKILKNLEKHKLFEEKLLNQKAINNWFKIPRKNPHLEKHGLG